MAGTKTGRTNNTAVSHAEIVKALQAANGEKTALEVARSLGMTEGAFQGRMTKLRAGYAEARKTEPDLIDLPILKDGRKGRGSGESLAKQLIMLLGTHKEYLDGLESEETDIEE